MQRCIDGGSEADEAAEEHHSAEQSRAEQLIR